MGGAPSRAARLPLDAARPLCVTEAGTQDSTSGFLSKSQNTWNLEFADEHA